MAEGQAQTQIRTTRSSEDAVEFGQEALTEDGCDKVDHINQREHRDRRDNQEHMEDRSSSMRRSTKSPVAFLEPIANQNTFSPDLFLQFDAKSQSRERTPGTLMPG